MIKRTLASISEDDEAFILKIMSLNNVKTVLEFGCGVSSLAMSKQAKVTSYETELRFAHAVSKENPDIDVRLWDGEEIKTELPHFDMAFVDGPAYGINREHSTKIASRHADIIIIHDANRPYEQKWQDKYLKRWFTRFMLEPTNKMCNCWVRA